jgi:hypothetical protein
VPSPLAVQYNKVITPPRSNMNAIATRVRNDSAIVSRTIAHILDMH